MDRNERHEELEKKVAQDRMEFDQALKGLRQTTKRRADVHTQMSEHPWPFIAVGFFFGYWLGSRVIR